MNKDRETATSELDEALLAVGSIDGRYRSRTRALVDYFSEFALIRYRVRVEIEWYLALAANPAIDAVPSIDGERAERLRFTLRGLHDRRCATGEGARSGDQSRRQGAGVLSQGKNRRSRFDAAARDGAFRLHFGGHQQSRVRADPQGVLRS